MSYHTLNRHSTTKSVDAEYKIYNLDHILRSRIYRALHFLYRRRSSVFDSLGLDEVELMADQTKILNSKIEEYDRSAKPAKQQGKKKEPKAK